MRLELFTVGPLEVNCCVLWDEQTREAAIIDCGARTDSERSQIDRLIKAERLTLLRELAVRQMKTLSGISLEKLPRLTEEM